MKKSIVVLIIVLLAVASIAIFLTSSSSPVKFLTVSGDSMAPVITQADMIAVAPVAPENLSVGDIITYRHEMAGGTVLITHRIVAIKDGGFITKGDSLDVIDSYEVKSTELIGVMKFKIPYLGSFIRFANTTPGFILLVLIPASLIIAAEIKYIISHVKKRKI